MGYRIVRMTGELLETLFTEGNTFPTQEGRILRVTKGLPEGAKLIGLSSEIFFDSNCWGLKFEHPSWGEHQHGCAIPVLDVQFEEVMPDPVVMVSNPPTAEDIEWLRRELEKAPRGRVVMLPSTPTVYEQDGDAGPTPAVVGG